MKYCPKCGTQNPIESKFCKGCGFSFMTVNEQTIPQNETSKSQNPKPIIEKRNNAKSFVTFIKKHKKIAIISFVILALGLTSLLLKNTIASWFNKPEDVVVIPEINDTPDVAPDALNNTVEETSSVTKTTSTPTPQIRENQIESQVKKGHTNVQQEEANSPNLETLSQYFSYLANENISFSAKKNAQNELINKFFQDKNFQVQIQGKNGFITGSSSIFDLTEEIKLSNTQVEIVEMKRPSKKLITELVITYKN